MQPYGRYISFFVDIFAYLLCACGKLSKYTYVFAIKYCGEKNDKSQRLFGLRNCEIKSTICTACKINLQLSIILQKIFHAIITNGKINQDKKTCTPRICINFYKCRYGYG